MVRPILRFLPLAWLVVLAIPAAAQVDVLTRHNDPARTGANLQERQLTPANVRNGTFGKLASRTVDGNLYAQPLVVTGAKIDGRRSATDMVILATEHNSVYAFDANDTVQASTTAQLWHTGPSILGPAVETSQLYADIGYTGCTDITTEVGITSTPAIKLSRSKAPKEGAVFVVAKSFLNGTYTYTLFALKLSTGIRLGSIQLQAQVPGVGVGSQLIDGKPTIVFDAEYALNRPALLLDGNTLYIEFGGHCDRGPYHGWVLAYDVSNPAAPRQIDALCITPNSIGGPRESRAGIWMSGDGPALGNDGSIYLATGDGTYDGVTEFGDSILNIKVSSSALKIQDWFTPPNQLKLKADDVDLGSGGVVLVPGTHLLLAGGKEGRLYLVDHHNMGEGVTPAVQSIQVTHSLDRRYYNLHGTPVIWTTPNQIFIYANGEENPFNQYRLVPDPSPTGAGWKFDPADAPYKSSADCPTAPNCVTSPYANFPTGSFGRMDRDEVWMPGASLAISSNGNKPGSAILWVTAPFADNANHQVVQGVLRALNASDVSQPELWDSESTGSDNDRLGKVAKFCPPTIANGKVYIATFQQETIEEGVHQKAPPPIGQPALVIYGLKH